MRRLLIAAIIAAGIVTTACGGLFDESCPSDYPVDCNNGSCCPSGYTCGSDNMCHGSGGGGGTYYVSANGCAGGQTFSYRGSSYSTCNAYYNAARAASCTKILDNCR
jgi:hypothetical protein